MVERNVAARWERCSEGRKGRAGEGESHFLGDARAKCPHSNASLVVREGSTLGSAGMDLIFASPGGGGGGES